MKDPQRWQELSALLDTALDLPDAQLDAWMRELELKNPDAAREVGRMLGHLTPPPETSTRPGAVLIDVHHALGELFTASETPPAPAAEPGQRFGPWKVTAKLGEGGMGEVWLAERADALFDGKAAIKLLRGHDDRERLQKRFARERKLLGRLNHPGIARLLDAGVAESQPYLVLEFVEGALLQDYLAARLPDITARVSLALQIAQALATAHAQLIVHRDLKPANVMVTPAGRVKLLDFGIAGLVGEAADSQQTSLTQLYGRGLTPAYAAPEQISGEATGVACDVYSFGVLLFEMLTGVTPFSAQMKIGRAALEHSVLHIEAPRLSTSLATRGGQRQAVALRPKDVQRARGDLEAIVAKCLRKEPSARYSSMQALITDLEQWLASRPVSAAGDDWRYRARLWMRRNWLPASLASLAIVALVGGLAVSLLLYQRANQARLEAEASAQESKTIRVFLTDDLLAGVDPNQQSIRDLSVSDLLARAEGQVAQRFANQPRVQALTYSAIADSYLALQRNDQASAALKQAITLADAHPQAITAAERLYFLSRQVTALWTASRFKDALAANERVEQGWGALEQTTFNRRSRLFARLLHGSLLVVMGQNQDALGLLEALQSEAADLPAPNDIPNNAAFQRSQALVALGNYREALPLLKGCVATASAQERGFDAAYMRSFLGQALVYAGELEAAEAALAESRRALAQMAGDDHAMLDLVYAFEGELKLRRQDAAAARSLLETADRRVIAHYGKSDISLVLTAPPLADALIQTGAASAALALIDDRLALAQQLLPALDSRNLALQLMRYRALMALAQPQAAKAALDASAVAAAHLPASHPLRLSWQAANVLLPAER